MSNIRRISPQEALELQSKGYIYLDVRTEDEFGEGHPKDAWNIPYAFSTPEGMSPNGDFLRVVEKHFPKDAKLILGCRSGNRSMKAAAVLVAAGFDDLFEQRAGFDAAKDAFGQIAEAGWSRAKLPVETGAGSEHSYASLKK